MLAGTVVIYALGVIQLSLIARLSIFKSIAVGVLPFLIGDSLKIIAAALITYKIKDRVRI